MTFADFQMTAELRAAPEAVRRQERSLSIVLTALVARLRSKPPQVVVTCARGSSAHAATFGKHLIERYLGIVVAAAAPSIATIYHQRLNLDGQSGRFSEIRRTAGWRDFCRLEIARLLA